MKDKEYQLPDPKEHPIDVIVIAYKTTKGVPYDDRSWDRVHYARCKKSAKELFEICGNLRDADACLVDIATSMESKGLSWTLETIVKHSHDWIAKKRGKNSDIHAQRARLFEAFAKRGRSDQDHGNSKESESIFDSGGSVSDTSQGH